jgi:peptide/nickel transport system permease protein
MSQAPLTLALDPATADRPGQVKSPTIRRRGGLNWRDLVRNRKSVVGAVILIIFVALALLAPLIAPGDPSALGGAISQPPSFSHLFGTTAKGQDVFAMTVWGSRASLTVGFIVGIGATLIGVVIGLASALFAGVPDDGLSLITNIFLLIPGLPFLVVLAAFFPPGPGTIAVALIITGWAGSARAIRSQALSVKSSGYVDAAVVRGEGSLYIMFREIMPNMASVVMGALLGGVIFGIGAEAGLEFLGLGDVSIVSWGTNLYWATNDGALLTGSWWEFVPSGTAIALVAFALAMANYAVDEITNPRLRLDRLSRKERKALAR